MSSKFEVIEKIWNSAKFTINIVRIPDDVIDDKLAVISDGTGTLSSTRYDQFLLNNCLLDADKVLRFLDSLGEEPEKMLDAAVELRNIIIEVNPLLNPELLIINNENIIKIPQQFDRPGEVRRLVDNPDWSKPEFNEPDDDDIEDFIRNMPPPVSPFGASGNNNPDNMVPHLWNETDLLLVIIKYAVNEVPEVFKDHTVFTDEGIYKKFIVTRCVHDFQNLFILLDRMGFTKKYGAENLTDMLYEISLRYNPFLAWSEIDLVKVKKAVERKYGKRKPEKNTFKKATAGDSKASEETVYTSFDDLTEDDVTGLSSRLKEWVVGQDDIVESVCETIELAKCGLKDHSTPIGTFMFTGETGVGKTYSAKMFAKELCGDEHAIIRIDCSEYSQRHEVSKLIGAPSGYVGYEEGGYLTNAISKRPFTVVLFDEVEKAHSTLHNILLQIMDEGRLTSNKGETVSFGETLIILTSNVGVKEVQSIGSRIGVGDVADVTKDKQELAIQEGLRGVFKPEFLNRLDGILTFNSLSRAHGLRIIDLAFNQINEWLAEKKVTVTYTKKAGEFLYSKGFKKGFGARPLKRIMKRQVMLPISRILLKQTMTGPLTINVSLKDDELIFGTTTNRAGSSTTAKEG